MTPRSSAAVLHCLIDLITSLSFRFDILSWNFLNDHWKETYHNLSPDSHFQYSATKRPDWRQKGLHCRHKKKKKAEPERWSWTRRLDPGRPSSSDQIDREKSERAVKRNQEWTWRHSECKLVVTLWFTFGLGSLGLKVRRKPLHKCQTDKS